MTQALTSAAVAAQAVEQAQVPVEGPDDPGHGLNVQVLLMFPMFSMGMTQDPNSLVGTLVSYV